MAAAERAAEEAESVQPWNGSFNQPERWRREEQEMRAKREELAQKRANLDSVPHKVQAAPIVLVAPKPMSTQAVPAAQGVRLQLQQCTAAAASPDPSVMGHVPTAPRSTEQCHRRPAYLAGQRAAAQLRPTPVVAVRSVIPQTVHDGAQSPDN